MTHNKWYCLELEPLALLAGLFAVLSAVFLAVSALESVELSAAQLSVELSTRSPAGQSQAVDVDQRASPAEN